MGWCQRVGGQNKEGCDWKCFYCLKKRKKIGRKHTKQQPSNQLPSPWLSSKKKKILNVLVGFCVFSVKLCIDLCSVKSAFFLVLILLTHFCHDKCPFTTSLQSSVVVFSLHSTTLFNPFLLMELEHVGRYIRPTIIFPPLPSLSHGRAQGGYYREGLAKGRLTLTLT